MLVHFANHWYGPDCRRYRKCERKTEVREVPDEYRDILPSSATIVGKRPVEDEFEAEDDYSAKAVDTLRSAWEDAEKLRIEAEARQEANLAEAQRRDEIKRKRQENMKKAQAARRAKIEARKKGN